MVWLAHINVQPGNRNHGLGKLITQFLVDEAQAKNCDTIYLIATDLCEPVYKKVGFETETDYLFLKILNQTIVGRNLKTLYPLQLNSRRRLPR